MFLIEQFGKAYFSESSMSLNPLNQVYVFNSKFRQQVSALWIQSLNPLNQVYVFNLVQAGDNDVPGFEPVLIP